MAASQTRVDVIGNNIANVATTGFKKQRVRFQDLFYDVMKAPGTPTTNGGENPAGVQVGNGVEVADTPRIFTQGRIEPTSLETNMAIEGPGFFRVQLPDGTEAYTRAGDFRPDSNGDLVNPEGFYLLPRINIPEDAEQVSISTTGNVLAMVNGQQQDVGQVTITKFRNPAGLIGVGRNLFVETEASGNPTEGQPLDDGFGGIRGSALEISNVDVVVELVGLILAQRSYELNSRTVSTSDEMLQTASQIGQ
jgi:flagellar basal-body rod protein FlgG